MVHKDRSDSLASVVVHELMHYVIQNIVSDPIKNEGLCELTSYLYNLAVINNQKVARALLSNSQKYQQAFNWALQAFTASESQPPCSRLSFILSQPLDVNAIGKT